MTVLLVLSCPHEPCAFCRNLSTPAGLNAPAAREYASGVERNGRVITRHLAATEGGTLSNKPLPVVEYLKIPDNGDPYLEGHKCGSCGAMYLGSRNVCSKCGARDQMQVTRLATTGKLYAYSIVHRTFPGIEVPYISAVVDLDDGATLKGNLIGIEPDPEKIKFDMPVEVVFADALGRKDREGNSYLSFFFKPKS